MSYFKLADKRTVYFDVDDTLVMWGADINNPKALIVDTDDGAIVVYPHTKHIQLLKDLKAIGWKIVIWSQGSSDHAERVIKKLQLEKYVDIITSKPESYVDDLPFEQQYIKRQYKPFEE